jgi:hypothetical protein
MFKVPVNNIPDTRKLLQCFGLFCGLVVIYAIYLKGISDAPDEIAFGTLVANGLGRLRHSRDHGITAGSR